MTLMGSGEKVRVVMIWPGQQVVGWGLNEGSRFFGVIHGNEEIKLCNLGPVQVYSSYSAPREAQINSKRVGYMAVEKF